MNKWIRSALSEIKRCCKGNKRKSYDKRKVRVAYLSQNAILLSPLSGVESWCGGNLDLPLQVEVEKGETVEHALARLLCPLYPESVPDVRFCLKHRSLCGGVEWEIFLFTVWCEDADIPERISVRHKLWTRRQIEANMGKGVFSHAFEEEYPHLSMVMDVWEMYGQEPSSRS